MEQFETNYSDNAELSYIELTECLSRRRHVTVSTVYPFMVNQSGYNNLGLMLSDQCPWYTALEINGSRMEIHGSVVKQFDRALELLGQINYMLDSTGISGMFRRFPTIAMEEALSNAYVHRDYSIEEPVRIVANEQGVTITSPGRPWVGDTLNIDRQEITRNDMLYRVFEIINTGAGRGKGLAAIRSAYKYAPVSPRVLCSNDVFMVVLPAVEKVEKGYGCHREKVLNLLAIRSTMTLREIASNLAVTAQYTRRILKRMESEGLIRGIGTGAGRRYSMTVQKSQRAQDNGQPAN